MRKRNPMARDLRVNPLYRSRKGKSRRDLEQRADRWSRAAKHKTVKSPGPEHGPGDGLSAEAAQLRRARAPGFTVHRMAICLAAIGARGASDSADFRKAPE